MEYLIKKEIKQLLQKLQEKCIEKNKKQGSNLNIEDYLFDMLVKVDNPEFRSDEDNEGLHLVEDILDNLILEVKSGIEIKSITETLFNDSELVEKLNNFLAENTEDYINCNLVRELYKKEPILTKDLLSDIFNNIILRTKSVQEEKLQYFGITSLENYKDVAISMRNVVNFCVQKRFVKEESEEFINYILGLDKELCEHLATLIEDNFLDLKLNFIMDILQDSM